MKHPVPKSPIDQIAHTVGIRASFISWVFPRDMALAGAIWLALTFLWATLSL